MSHVSKIIIIIIIIILIKKRIKVIKKIWNGQRVSVLERERDLFFNFSSFRFFLRSTKIGPRDFFEARGKVHSRIESYT